MVCQFYSFFILLTNGWSKRRYNQTANRWKNSRGLKRYTMASANLVGGLILTGAAAALLVGGTAHDFLTSQGKFKS